MLAGGLLSPPKPFGVLRSDIFSTPCPEVFAPVPVAFFSFFLSLGATPVVGDAFPPFSPAPGATPVACEGGAPLPLLLLFVFLRSSGSATLRGCSVFFPTSGLPLSDAALSALSLPASVPACVLDSADPTRPPVFCCWVSHSLATATCSRRCFSPHDALVSGPLHSWVLCRDALSTGLAH